MTQISGPKERKMSDAYVDMAATWTRELVQRESRGPGDTKNAMKRLSARHGIAYATLWALRYRRPKDMLVSVYGRVREAYLAETERQLRKLEQEIEITRAIAGADCRSVRTAQALVDAAHGGEAQE